MASSELCMEKAIGEPFKIKMVEHIRMTTREERLEEIRRAKYNPLRLNANLIAVDLLTDSGVGAMSNAQWAGLMCGDESYTGSRSFGRLESTVRSITGLPYVVPAHQGRGAEHILFHALLEEQNGNVVLSNGAFETTENIIHGTQCKTVNITEAGGANFAGNMDCDQLEEFLKPANNNISCVVLVITNNVICGQPVSMHNIEIVSKLCRQHNVPLVVDGCRFVENAWYIKTMEEGYMEKSVRDIVKEMFSHVDAVTVSAKKNGLSNSGGFISLKSEDMYIRARRKCIVYEGHFTYGGMSGRDMEAIATGLEECLDDIYLQYRFDSLNKFAGFLKETGVPVTAVTSSAVFVDARKLLPHLTIERQPSWSLACALYIEGGIRGFGDIVKPGQEDDWIKLGVPHRLYTMSHFQYVAKVFERVIQIGSRIRGLNVTFVPDFPQQCYEVELEPVQEQDNVLEK